MNDRLLHAVDDEVADLLCQLPTAWLDELGAEDAFLLGPAVVAALCRAVEEANGQPAGTVWQAIADSCVFDTPFYDIRMEAQTGPICAVASQRTSSIWYSWLPLGSLTSGPVAAPLALVLHGIERRARELRNALGPWAESTGSFVLAPEFLTDARAPLADLDYATGQHAAQAALELVEELAERVDASFPKFIVMTVGSGGAVVPALLREAPERVAGCVLVSPDAESVLAILNEGPLPEAAPGVRVVVVAGGSDTVRPARGSSTQTGLGDARRVVTALKDVDVDVRLQLVPGSDGRVLRQRSLAVPGSSTPPTAMMHAAAAAAAGLLQ